MTQWTLVLNPLDPKHTNTTSEIQFENFLPIEIVNSIILHFKFKQPFEGF